jgi:spermidine/putrescine transport system substrate-binding protein
MSRREFLRRSAGAAVAMPSLAAVLAACGRPETGSTPEGSGLQLARPDDPVTLPLFDDNPAIDDGLEPEQGATLKIYNWIDYVWKKVVQQFCDEYNCDYEITTFISEAESLQKMSTGLVADVYFPTANTLGKLAQARLIQPVNHSYIPNLEANMWPVYQDPFYDQGWGYTVPYTVYTTGVGYRRDVVSDDEVAEVGYDLLWDPRFSGRAGVYEDYREVIAMTLLRRFGPDVDVNTGDAEMLEQAKNDILELTDLVDVRVSINGAYAQLPDGKMDVHQAWSGDMVGAQWYLPDLKTPGTTDVLGYWYPDDKRGLIGNDMIAIPATAENPVLAHHFLNFLLDQQHGFDNFTWVGYQPPMTSINPETLIKADEGEYAPNTGPGVVPPSVPKAVVTQDNFDTGSFLLELSPEVDGMWQDAWDEFKAGAQSDDE